MRSGSVLRWGILAPGRIAQTFAEALVVVEGARLHAVASRNRERGEQFTREHRRSGEWLRIPDWSGYGGYPGGANRK